MSKTDIYANYGELAANEHEGNGGYRRIQCIRDSSTIAIIAPHGGGIEPGTSEIATMIAGNEYTLYRFEGCKKSCNQRLHITSECFDEPKCRAIVGQSERVVAIHGCQDGGCIAYVGGRDENLGRLIIQALAAAGFKAQVDETHHAGTSKQNICNRSSLGKGVQLELTLELRRTMFEGFNRSGRERKTPSFYRFVDSIRSVLAKHLDRSAGSSEVDSVAPQKPTPER